jgi:hypothetical protein
MKLAPLLDRQICCVIVSVARVKPIALPQIVAAPTKSLLDLKGNTFGLLSSPPAKSLPNGRPLYGPRPNSPFDGYFSLVIIKWTSPSIAIVKE